VSRTEALRLYDQAKAHVVVLRIEADPPDAEVLLDGRSLGRGPFQREIYLEPGKREVEARAEGREPKRTTIAGDAGTLEKVMFELRPAGAPAEAGDAGSGAQDGDAPGAQADAAPAAPSRHPMMPILIGGAATGGLALVIGIVLHAAAGGPASTADDLITQMRALRIDCAGAPPGGSSQRARACTELRSLREEHDGLANAGTALLIGGGLVLAGTGGYLLWSHLDARSREQAKPNTALAVTPAIGARGGGMWVRGRF
jgi:hypothetical protein